MSGFVRTIEKRIMKRAGMHRRDVPLQIGDGLPPVVLPLIFDQSGECYGLRWPRRIPAQFSGRASA
ncbi:hypothetical protein [Stakelama tenebrarum]|uniref:Uncharacterized protein n=1 Tax=Stakelama tenebrarum TaxID=2711215 RepID=A0A6G6Y567_9SPHN|nr:hypothetical protein [Sphingosinithalassobacter tenebrarum]QIG80094.1 hypothetical protein G5C33_10085 [Sphingosinithalassobacter tenebrarum]